MTSHHADDPKGRGELEQKPPIPRALASKYIFLVILLVAAVGAFAWQTGRPETVQEKARSANATAMRALSAGRLEEAARDFRVAADLGVASAQYWLAVFYEAGKGGLPVDQKMAVHYFMASASNGDAAGQVNLGSLYEFGFFGVPRDIDRAAELYRKSAAQGDPFGQCMLGDLYRRGQGGLAKDMIRADALYASAATRGVKPELRPNGGCSRSKRG